MKTKSHYLLMRNLTQRCLLLTKQQCIYISTGYKRFYTTYTGVLPSDQKVSYICRGASLLAKWLICASLDISV